MNHVFIAVKLAQRATLFSIIPISRTALRGELPARQASIGGAEAFVVLRTRASSAEVSRRLHAVHPELKKYSRVFTMDEFDLEALAAARGER